MPRNGSGVYFPPAGSDTVSANTTILSSLQRALVDDLELALNTAWPVALGGTGGTTPASSLIALGAAAALQLSAPLNLGLAASVGSSALTIALKGADGNDPSATNPVVIPFRNVTLATGTPSFLTITAATSLVISSGSTLGFTSGAQGRLVIVGFNDGGTFRLGVINLPLGASLADGIASSTAEGGAGGADSANVIYTGTAVTSKAMVVLGFLYATEATAGTWATAPSTLQVGTAAGLIGQFFPITQWVPFTPTFTGFGTAASISIWSRRVGDSLEIRGNFTAGTPTATEARMTLGFNGTDANVTSDATKVAAGSVQLAGPATWSAVLAAAASGNVLIESNKGYVTFGFQTAAAAGLTKQNGDAFSGVGMTISINATIPISGW